MTPQRAKRAESAQEQRWQDALRGLTDAHPVWVTLTEILRGLEEEAIERAARYGIEAEERAWEAGFLSAIRDVKRGLWVYSGREPTPITCQ